MDSAKQCMGEIMKFLKLYHTVKIVSGAKILIYQGITFLLIKKTFLINIISCIFIQIRIIANKMVLRIPPPFTAGFPSVSPSLS